MSYIMTSTGPRVEMAGMEPVELLPVAEAQDYIKNLEAEIAKRDGNPVFFVHDGRTGTSHDLIRESVNAVIEGEPIETTQLFKVLTRVAEAGHIVRIWWADENLKAFLKVEQCHSFDEAIATIQKQAGNTVALRATLGKKL